MTIERAFASASDTLDQTSYTQVNSMTLTPPSGTYLAVFSMNVKFGASPGGNILKIAVYLDGSIVDHSERELLDNASLTDMNTGVVTSALVTTTGSEVVEIKYIIDGGSMTGTNRELNLLPAPNTNYQDTATGDTTTTNNSFVVLDSMTRTPASGTYLAIFTASFSPGGDESAINLRMREGGTAISASVVTIWMENSANPSSYCAIVVARVTPNGSQAIDIQWQRWNAANTETCHERNLILIAVANDADIVEVGGTRDVQSNYTTDQIIADMSIDNLGNVDYLMFFTGSFVTGVITTDVIMTFKVFSDSSELTTDLRRTFEQEDSVDLSWSPIFMSGRVTIAKLNDDITLKWSCSTSDDSRSIEERNLVLIREAPTLYKMDGITKDNAGVALGSCQCYLLKDNGDNTFSFIAHQVSNSSTGAYSFTGLLDNSANYQVVAWKDDSPHVFDVTDHVLVPVAE